MTAVLDEIRRSICSRYEFEEIGIREYLVHTDMYYDDGDELHIVLRIRDDGFHLTDEGHTLMWLSYEDFNFTDSRRRLLDGIIGQNSVELDDGAICVSVGTADEVGPALLSMIQAMLGTANLRHLSRSNVANTFMEDIRSAFASSDLKDRCDFTKRIEVSNDAIVPDVYIESDRPVLLFGAGSRDRAKEVYINLLLARSLGQRYRTVVVIDDNAGILRMDRDRLINTADRPIMGKEGVVDLTKEFIGETA